MKAYLRNVAFEIVVGLAIGMLLGSVRGAKAHDHDHPEQNEWYQSLMQPDNPTMSCCGEADAYWADDVHFRDGKTYVTITDDRDDGPLKRPHIANGTEIEVPNNKLKWDRGNPTSHGVIFLSPHPYNFVYCYVQPGGV
jgi:hypothetical protein